MTHDEEGRVEYWLSIRFNSNENPWESSHYNHYPKWIDLDEAIDWARYLRDHMYGYTVTLFGDGKMIEVPDDETEMAT